jgi:hypothetical protein
MFFKSGILVLVVFLPIIFTVYVAFDEPTDNLVRASRYVPIVANHSISIAVVLTYLVTLGTPNDFTLFLKERPYSNGLVLIMFVDLGV